MSTEIEYKYNIKLFHIPLYSIVYPTKEDIQLKSGWFLRFYPINPELRKHRQNGEIASILSSLPNEQRHPTVSSLHIVKSRYRYFQKQSNTLVVIMWRVNDLSNICLNFLV